MTKLASSSVSSSLSGKCSSRSWPQLSMAAQSALQVSPRWMPAVMVCNDVVPLLNRDDIVDAAVSQNMHPAFEEGDKDKNSGFVAGVMETMFQKSDELPSPQPLH